MDSFVPKKKSAAESVTPEVLVNLRHRKTTHTLPGEVVQGVFKKFTRFRADKYNRLYIRYVKNACNTVYRITKVINFPQSATTCLYWGRAAESIAEKRRWGLWSPYDLWCVPYDLRTVCLALPGFTKQAASRREAACLVLLMERLLAQGSYAHVRFACAFLAEFDGAVYKGEERVIFTDTHVFTGVVNRAALTNDNVARLCELATEQFDAESLAFRLTSVLRTTYTFLVCHFSSVLKGYATISSTRTCVRY